MQENRIWRGQNVLGGAPLQEAEHLFHGRGAERSPAGSQADPAAIAPLDAVAEGRGGGGGGGGVVQGEEGWSCERVVSAEFQDGGSDGDAARGYRSSPSVAKRLTTCSMSRWMVSARVPSSSAAMASAMAGSGCEPSQ